MMLILIDNTRIHIFMYSIPRRHFTCPFTDLLNVNKRTAIHDSNIYIHVTGENFVLGPIDKTKIISSRISYQTTLLLGKPNAVGVKGMRSFVLLYDFYHHKVYTEPIKQASMVQWLFHVPYKPETAGLIRVFLRLSDETIN